MSNRAPKSHLGNLGQQIMSGRRSSKNIAKSMIKNDEIRIKDEMIAMLEGKISEVQRKYEMANQRSKEAKLNLDRNNADNMLEIQSLQASIQDLQTRLSDKEKSTFDYDHIKAENFKLQNEIGQIRNILVQQRNEEARRGLEIAGLERQYRTQIKNLENEISKRGEDVEIQKEQLNENQMLCLQLSETKAHLAKTEEDLHICRSEKAEIADEKEGLQLEITQLQEELNKCLRSMTMYDRENATSRQKLRFAEEQLAQLSTVKDTEKMNETELRDKLASTTTQLNKSRKKAKHFADKAEVLTRNQALANEQINTFKSELEASQDELKKTKKRTQYLNERLKVMSVKLKETSSPSGDTSATDSPLPIRTAAVLPSKLPSEPVPDVSGEAGIDAPAWFRM
eukprot:TRINITY_DN1319_c0_g1_i11.p1 TRINITY_DN1319_c0_g1~~TRINITY_DN1319_c0_g1_i11.p1  ORF type:complete len:397 (+),score=93.11 TRINITY_DN1319_c0_g1_i11:132-1322(+)